MTHGLATRTGNRHGHETMTDNEQSRNQELLIQAQRHWKWHVQKLEHKEQKLKPKAHDNIDNNIFGNLTSFS